MNDEMTLQKENIIQFKKQFNHEMEEGLLKTEENHDDVLVKLKNEMMEKEKQRIEKKKGKDMENMVFFLLAEMKENPKEKAEWDCWTMTTSFDEVALKEYDNNMEMEDMRFWPWRGRGICS